MLYEPLGTNAIINLYRRLTPSMRTPDEHPLVRADFELVRAEFSEVDVSYHNFLALGGTILHRLPSVGDVLVKMLQRLDEILFRALPAVRRLVWVTVIHVRT